MDEQFSSDLSSWLNNVADRYVVTQTLRQTSIEVTQVVYRADAEGTPSVGPFIRKRFLGVKPRGVAYEQLLQAQAKGIRLAHQPILYECERTGDTLDVVMEYVNGLTLHDLANQQGPGLGLAMRIVPDLCDALSELHESFEQPIIHRDVKPSNVIVSERRLTLIDLGIARLFQKDAERDTVRLGTPGYAPPEQYGYGQTSVRSDVYALGMTLAFCLTGEEPSQQLRANEFVDPRIPVFLRPVLCKAAQFDPAQRYASARELKTAFLSAAGTPSASAGASTHASTYAVPTPSNRPNAAQPTDAPRRQRFTIIGRIWNCLVLFVWALMLAALANGIIHPIKSMVNTTIWYRLCIYVFLFLTSLTALAYLLLDKRRLRKYKPFSMLTWKQEIPICIGVSFLGFIIAFLIYSYAG